ncbi:MAG: GNAT family N-acetyltransferase [Tissierellaceae bacterium]
MRIQPTLETDRLILRPFLLSDAKIVQKLAGDYKIAVTTLNIPHPYEDGMAESWIGTHSENFKEGNGVTYAIVNKSDGSLIGAIGLMINKVHRRAELGYWIGVPFWNRGYCTEASKVIVQYGFEKLDINKIFARALVSNTGSWKVMEKTGMSYEGTLKHEVLKDGIPLDLKTYAIIREDYKLKNII